MKQLPIGTQSFEVLRSNDFLYVDKTEDILHLVTNNRGVFFSRPRRFGKSLLVSTMEELFKGNKTLFEGLYICDKWDWTQQYPVIRIDWTDIKHQTAEEIERSMFSYLMQRANYLGLTLVSEYADSLFSELIAALHRKTEKRVVVLIDEYDSPILEAIGQPEAESIRNFLQGFYRRLKANDEHLQFVFLTGITKVAKLSIFSVLNNLNDITLNAQYASICGYTQQELENVFSDHIAKAMLCLEMTKEGLLQNIRKWYDGYTWDGKTAVYNPFSTLLFFNNSAFSGYWYSTGSSTFLADRLKKRNITGMVLEPVIVGSSAFDSCDTDNIGDIPLLFQTGYLTVKERKLTGGIPSYTLGVPNLEVREALMEHLLIAYTQFPQVQLKNLAADIAQNFSDCDSEGLQNNLRQLFAGVAYTLLPADNEAYYHTIYQILMTLLGFEIQSDRMTNRGRMDAVVLKPGLAVVTEIKYHAKKKPAALLKQAIAQIREKRYYEPFLDRKVILLGLAFSGKEVSCRIEPLK
ncbi:ATPase AAA [Bacteroidia bacterium]|nr:ATPase AAA [Bacteroidia bacterium]